MTISDSTVELPEWRVDVIEPGGAARPGRIRCLIGSHIKLSVESLKAYCYADWNPIVFDALLVAAAVEFCDRTKLRPAGGWSRYFELRVPVHESALWSSPEVSRTLHDALSFLTDDRWQISFSALRTPVAPPRQRPLPIPKDDYTIIPFSDGMDSRIVAAMLQKQLDGQLIRVRLGSNKRDHRDQTKARRPQLFTAVPYTVGPLKRDFTESSCRSRGFKFLLAAGLAAYLSNSSRVVVPESGQGALGPWLVPVAHAPQDCRNHPMFARRMECFLRALLEHDVRYEFPRLWFTKGETLRDYVAMFGDDGWWQNTRSCWQRRFLSVGRHLRQCGICAACILRRMSVHAAGLNEPEHTYLWNDLGASTFEKAAAITFAKPPKRQREYAIAGVLHLDHLAALRASPTGQRIFTLRTPQLSTALGEQQDQVAGKLGRLLSQHANEWEAFVQNYRTNSFIADWLPVGP